MPLDSSFASATELQPHFIFRSFSRLTVEVLLSSEARTVGDNDLYCAPLSAAVPSLSGGTQPVSVLCSKTEQTTTDLILTQPESRRFR